MTASYVLRFLARLMTGAVLCLVLGNSAAFPAAPDAAPRDLNTMVETERTFSQTCGRIGVRDAFLQFFADDVITFGPALQRGKAHLQALPVGSSNGPVLQWQPVYGDMSLAGDLGYSTGPWVSTPKSGEPHYGIFFSIWKKQPDGKWLVILDAGVNTPKPPSSAADFHPAPQRGRLAAADRNPDTARFTLAQAEIDLNEKASRLGLQSALLSAAGDPLRLHRPGMLPLMGKSEVEAYLKAHDSAYSMKELDGGIAASGDLGYTIGEYLKQPAAAGPQEHGYYVRVWRRDAHANWRLAVDTMFLSPNP